MKYLIHILLLSAILTGCKVRQEVAEDLPVRYLEGNSDLAIYSDFIEEVTFIQLDSDSDKYLLSDINQLVPHNDKWFVLDNTRRQAVFAFDNTGKPLALYDRVGRAPGEYNEIEGFDVDPRSGDIILLCGPKLILLDENLQFKREINAQAPYERAAFHGDGILFYSYFLSRVDFMSLENEKIETVFEFEREKNNALSPGATIFIREEDALYFQTVEIDKLYRVEEDGEFTAVAEIDYEGKKEGQQLYKEKGRVNMSLEEIMKYSRPRIMCIINQNGRLSFIYNEVSSYINIDMGAGQYKDNKIGTLWGSTDFVKYKNNLIGWESPANYNKENYESVISYYPKNYEGLKINYLDATRDEVIANGNPIIVVYKLRSNLPDR